MAAMAAIGVDRPDALSDQPLEIAATGFRPGEVVELSSSRVDFQNRFWRAAARFRADAEGRVAPAHDAPLDGSYRSVSPMGLFWSMTPLEEAAPGLPQRDIAEPLSVGLHAKGLDSGTRARAEVTRRFAGPGVTGRELREDGLVGRLFLPAGDGPHPAMIVLGGSSGGLNLPPAALLASHGYATLALGYFALPGLPDRLQEIPLEYFGHAIGWLRHQPEVAGDFIGVLGASRGAELALLLGATYPSISAVVGFAASGVLHGGLARARGGERRTVAWTCDGQPLPALDHDNRATETSAVDWGRPPVTLAPLFRSSLRDAEAVARATVPVERIVGPVLLVSGADDAMWPAVALSEIAVRRLAGHPYPVRHLVYEDAGHMIFPPFAPTTLRHREHAILGTDFAFGGTAAGDAAAGADCWPKILEFLGEAVEAIR